MTLKLTPAKHVFTLLFIMGLGVTCAAFVLEYVFHAEPCTMCWWQRYVHWSVLGLAAIGLMSSIIVRRFLLILTIFVGAIGLAIACWQAGAQLDLWGLPPVCSGGAGQASVSADLLGALQGFKAPPQCDDSGFTIFGLSLAMWNIPTMLAIIFIAAWGRFQQGDK